MHTDDLPQLAPPTDVPPRRITWAVEAHSSAPASATKARVGHTVRATAGSGGGDTLVPPSSAVPAMTALRAPRLPDFDSMPRKHHTPGPHRFRARRHSSRRMKRILDADGGPQDLFDPAELFPFWEEEVVPVASPRPRVSELSTTELIASLVG